MIEHPNIKKMSCTLEGPPNDIKRVVVVETDLQLDSLNPQYNQEKVDSLITTLEAHINQHRDMYDSVRVRTS